MLATGLVHTGLRNLLFDYSLSFAVSKFVQLWEGFKERGTFILLAGLFSTMRMLMEVVYLVKGSFVI